ncbi:MAG: hypothetical protein KDC85_23275, partial [Saprospiraceae bacterium]|nr:hypothetical protein [Saprospiraceae bacterium]
MNCSLNNTSVCPIIQDVLTPGCNTFGGGSSVTGMYSLDIATCNAINATDVIGVDIIPATDFSALCPSTGTAITDGIVTVSYEICLVYTYDQDIPPACTNTISLNCNDGNSCTINDVEVVDACDNSIICIPCQGTPLDCLTGPATTQSCDDGDACTINDEQVVLDCDGSICVPCQGTPVDCANGTTSIQPCDDGNSCTINDVQVMLDCDGSICEPCKGTPLDCSTGPTTTQACDDGNPNTINDMETVLDCDGSICIPCQGTLGDCTTGPTTTQACDDSDPCTIN